LDGVQGAADLLMERPSRLVSTLWIFPSGDDRPLFVTCNCYCNRALHCAYCGGESDYSNGPRKMDEKHEN